jgi:hypothetical protein
MAAGLPDAKFANRYDAKRDISKLVDGLKMS